MFTNEVKSDLPEVRHKLNELEVDRLSDVVHSKLKELSLNKASGIILEI